MVLPRSYAVYSRAEHHSTLLVPGTNRVLFLLGTNNATNYMVKIANSITAACVDDIIIAIYLL